MASKKGIIITAAIAAAVIGASSIVWIIPQSNLGSYSNPRSFQDTFSSVYSQNNDLATAINGTFQKWKIGQVSSQIMLQNITQAAQDTSDMKNKLAGSNPSSEYQKSFSLYEGALDSFGTYLSKLKNYVDSNHQVNATSNTPQDSQITSAWLDWQKQVDESVGALPVGS